MSRTVTHRLSTNLERFLEDRIITHLGNNHAANDRCQITYPSELKPRYPDKRIKNFNEARAPARLLIRQAADRVKFTRARPARPDDIITVIDDQWYCMRSNGKLRSTFNSRESAISYAKKVIAASANVDWRYTTVKERLAASNLFARV